MTFGKNFRPMPSMSAEQVRAYIESNQPGSFNLIDVRQRVEYENGHIPGAELIPLPELALKWRKLDTGKPSIVYCRSGNRSQAAALLLSSAGIHEVYNMEGGMLAWKGLSATGSPETGMAVFPPDAELDEIVSLAWAMEKGAREFYSFAAASLLDAPLADIFRELSKAEERHEKSLLGEYAKITGKNESNLSKETAADLMEGGVNVKEALKWAKGKDSMEILEFSMSMETNSYDLYLKITQRVDDDAQSRIFKKLADEEWGHLLKLSDLLDNYVR